MKKNDLKSIWNYIHENNQNIIEKSVNIEKIKNMEHCKSISKFITELKIKIAIYSFSLVTLIGILIYVYLYLKLKLSIPAVLPFAIAWMFLLFKVTSEIIRFSILTNSSDNLSLKESAIFFKKKLNRIKSFDFIMYLVLCYVIATGFLLAYLMNINGIRFILQSNDMSILLIVFISILLIIPWIIKKSFNQRYKNLFSNLNDTVNYLDDAS